MRTEYDVLEEWRRRGWLGDEFEPSGSLTDSICLSYIQQGKEYILNYCHIPLAAPVPAGLFYAWVEIAWDICKSYSLNQGSALDQGAGQPGAVESITEGDTTVKFASGVQEKAQAAEQASSRHMAMLNKYRRMPW